jgi:hypothetical protein
MSDESDRIAALEAVAAPLREALEASSRCCETSVWHQCNLRFEALKKAALAPGAGARWAARHALLEAVAKVSRDDSCGDVGTHEQNGDPACEVCRALAALDAQEKR